MSGFLVGPEVGNTLDALPCLPAFVTALVVLDSPPVVCLGLEDFKLKSKEYCPTLSIRSQQMKALYPQNETSLIISSPLC